MLHILSRNACNFSEAWIELIKLFKFKLALIQEKELIKYLFSEEIE